MLQRLSIVAAFAGSLALSGCVVDEWEDGSDIESAYAAADTLSPQAGTVAKDILAVDRGTMTLSRDVLKILKHTAGHIPDGMDETRTMERWESKVHDDVQQRSIAAAKAWYDGSDNGWLRVSLGYTEQSYDELSEDKKLYLLSYYLKSQDYWQEVEPAMDELADKLAEIKACDVCPLPVNAPQLLYHTQFLAFRAFRSGIGSPTAAAAAMYVDALQQTLERKLKLNDLSRTGINVPRRPPVDYADGV